MAVCGVSAIDGIEIIENERFNYLVMSGASSYCSAFQEYCGKGAALSLRHWKICLTMVEFLTFLPDNDEELVHKTAVAGRGDCSVRGVIFVA